MKIGKIKFDDVKKTIKYGREFTSKWLNKAPVDELKAKREAIHKVFLNPNTEQPIKEKLIRYLDILDNYIAKRGSVGGENKASYYVREHGRNLWKKD